MGFKSVLLLKGLGVASYFVYVIGIFYYATILSAVVSETDEWSTAMAKSFAFAVPMIVLLLYFHRFKLVKLVYGSIAITGIILYTSLYLFGSTYTVPVNVYGETDLSFLLTGNVIHNLIVIVHHYLFIWSPYIFFILFLRRGYERRCPKCKPEYGIYSRKLLNSELLRTESYTSNETTTKESPIYIAIPCELYQGKYHLNFS